jgi:Ion channel
VAEIRRVKPSSRSRLKNERWLLRIERFSDAFGLVFVLVLATYVLTSVLPNHGWQSVVLTLITSITSVVALTSSHAKPQTIRVAVALSVMTVVFAIVFAIVGGRDWLTADSVVQVFLLSVAMLSVLRRVVLTSEGVEFRTILGAISVYTVLGLLFSYLYDVIERIQSGPFFEGVAHPSGSDFLFFSYTTLTTTGYGDLVPGGQPGRMIAGIEMMIGQIFLVTLVAGLVSLWRPGEGIRRRREEREGRQAEREAGAPPADPA